MKQFSFRYQTVLEVRERRQKAEEEVLQRMLAAQRREEAELARLRAEHEAKWAEWQAAQREAALDLQSLVLYQGFIEGMERHMRRQQDLIADITARCDEQRKVLLAAMRETEIMAKLKERDLAAWRLAIDQAEDAMLDELAMARHARKEDF